MITAIALAALTYGVWVERRARRPVQKLEVGQ